MTDERLQRIYAEVLARRASTDRVACPAPEALLALVERAGAEAERLHTLDHVMSCGACRSEFELLRAVAGAGADRTRSTWRSWRRWAALAAAITVIAGVGLVTRWVERQNETEVMRGTDAPGVALLTPADGASLPADRRLAWRAVPGAARYTVEILDADDRAVYATGTPDTVIALPDSIRFGTGDYRWWVRARRGDGSEVASRLWRLRGGP
jgi:hypothetical protein